MKNYRDLPKPCETCGKDMYRKPNESFVKFHFRKNCSAECRAVQVAKHNRDRWGHRMEVPTP